MPSTAHYSGNHIDDLLNDKANNRLFGPDSCGPARPGQVVGHGAHYELADVTYDAETDRTTATFTPYVPPDQRGRIRYYGADMQEIDAPDDVGTPTLAARDNIAGR